MQGVVTRLVPERGCGFIAADGQEFFFQLSALQGTGFDELAEGQTVEFQPKFDEPGDQPGEDPRAVSVHLADFEVPAVDNELLPPGKIAP